MLRTFALLAWTACAVDAFPESPHPGATRSIPWSVSRHVFPPDDTRVGDDLDAIAALGARYVRTDVWWYAVEPSQGSFDQMALDYYRGYVDEAGRRGLGVIAILSNAPSWARSLYDAGRRGEFATAFEAYGERVAATLGDQIVYYQLWNEPNNVADFPDGDTDIALFVAGRTGIERGRAAIGATAPYLTAINLLVDGHDGPFGHWEDDARYYLDHGARDAIDIIAIDHYPGTWSIGDWGGNIVDRLFALGGEQGKRIAIFELGYATSRCTLPFNTEDGQLHWISEQLPRLRDKLSVLRGAPFELVNWFKLDDRNTGNCFDPEDNFGIVRTDRSRKPGFPALAAEIARF